MSEHASDRSAIKAQRALQLRAVERRMKILKASSSLISLAELLNPDPNDPDDVSRTRYKAQPFHRALARALEEIEEGAHQYVIICMPPRHGKSELASKIFTAYAVGRDPYRHIMLATYNQPFANDFGKKVRDIMLDPVFQQVFPECRLKKGSQAVDRLETEQGGVLAFVGRGGSITGRGADLFIIDDPLKNSKEADSETTRNDLWTWFNNDVLSRGMSDTARVIIIQTRWHEDDLVGRLTDKDNPNYSEEEARKWKIINIPAICEEDNEIEQALGRKPGDALWPERFSAEYLLRFKHRDGRGFMALYQQRPAPMDGEMFKQDMISLYERSEIPKRMRIYAASDHAVTEKQEADYTCMVVVGVDETDVIYVLDCVWDRLKPDEAVEKMIGLMRKWRPVTWYAERDHIVKTIGPFLRKRMREEKVYCHLKDMSAHMADKVGKQQAILGRMSMHMVRFPKHAPWKDKAIVELLKFPRARYDDFVDALGLIGRALDVMLTGSKPPAPKVKAPPGTWAYFKAVARYEKRAANLRLAGGM